MSWQRSAWPRSWESASPPSPALASPIGVDWTIQASAADNNWTSVTYGTGLCDPTQPTVSGPCFVAVALSGTGNRVMTSPDGVAWTARASAANISWSSVTYGNGLFVAVARSGTGNRVMTSPDGVTWTARASAADNNWYSVTYGTGLCDPAQPTVSGPCFVAVAITGTGNRVMTSPDGVIWTARASAADNSWYSVTYGTGLCDPAQPTVSGPCFVAVAITGTGNRVMTSPDGITWTARASAADIAWTSVTYGNGLFVAVAASGSGNRVMTSPDGIAWTVRASAADNSWYGVTYGSGLFVAVAASGTGTRVMTSPDAIAWTARASAADNNWDSVTYGNGTFVAVAATGTGNRVMTSVASGFTVTFDANGGTGSMSPQTASAPTALTSNTFTRAGFTFAGWDTQALGGGTAYADNDVFPFSANATLYAQWTPLAGLPDIPAAPTATVASATSATVAVPVSTSGPIPTSYTVNASPGNGTCTITLPASPQSCTISGLTSGNTYTFTATATNGVGTTNPSPASASIDLAGPNTPSAVTGVPGPASIVATITPASSGGTPASFTVTAYDALSASAGICTVAASVNPLSCTITGLTPGEPYTLEATAVNGISTATPSSPSAPVVPTAVPVVPVVPDTAPPPLVVFQGLPLPTTGSCLDVDDTAYAWGTGLTGGWQRSWQPWGGGADIGGWACIRIMVNTAGPWHLA